MLDLGRKLSSLTSCGQKFGDVGTIKNCMDVVKKFKHQILVGDAVIPISIIIILKNCGMQLFYNKKNNIISWPNNEPLLKFNQKFVARVEILNHLSRSENIFVLERVAIEELMNIPA